MFWCVPPAMRDEHKAAIATLSRVYGGQIFASDMLVTLLKNQTFLWDESFCAAVKAEAQDDWDQSILWRTHTAEWAALDRLWDRIVSGGIVLLDDFGWAPQLPQTIGQLDFFRERGHEVLELPTGQGMVIKHGARA